MRSPAELVYRVLLCVFPRGFRTLHGDAMTAEVLRQHRALVGRPVKQMALWIRIVGDALQHGLGVRRDRAYIARRRPVPAELIAMNSDALADCREVLRRWFSRPALPTAVVLTLALGIGATIAIFSIANTVLIKPLPWPDPDRLFAVRSVIASQTAPSSGNQLLTWADWKALRDVPWIERVGIWTAERMLLGLDRTEPVDVIYASSDVLSLLGATPALGRLFRPDEDKEEQSVVLLSHGTWTQRFGASPDALQQSIVLSFNGLNGRQRTYTVIGVLPHGFSVEGRSPDFVLPSGMVSLGWQMSDQLQFRVIAKTRPGTAVPAASEVLEHIAQSSGPAERASLELRSLSRELLASSTGTVLLLLSAAGLLLLVSCSSASGLLLGHAWSRRSEVAVRLSLGATRSRIARQFAVEHALLGIVAAVVGLLLAAWLTPVFVAMAPDRLPRLEAVTIDLTVVMFALGLGAMSSVIFGTAPSLILAGVSGADTLTESRAVTVRPHTWQRVLVSVQIGLAVTLAVSASLLGGTMLRLQAQPLGFESAQLAMITTTPLSFEEPPVEQPRRIAPGTPRPALTPEASAALMNRASQQITLGYSSLMRGVLDRIAAIPGVTGVAGADALPFLVPPRAASVQLEGHTAEHRSQRSAVSPDYFRVMGIQLVSGRTFEVLEMPGDIAIVSETFEREVVGGSAVGKRFSITSGRPLRIVGVVADVRMDHAGEPLPTFYVPLVQVSQFIVRATGDPAAVLPLIRESLGGSDARVVITRSTTMRDVLSSAIAEDVFRAALSALFGGLALILSLVGVNALVVRWVTDRRRDLGIRIALGATPADIRSLVLRHASIAVAAGIGVGIPAALFATGLLRTVFMDLGAHSAFIYVAVPVLVAAMAMLGAWLPAVRAGRLAPVELIRR